MKKYLLIFAFALLAISVFNFCGRSTTKDQPGTTNEQSPTKEIAKIQYTCPMHPEVVSDTTGTCPKCGMPLVEKK